MGVDMFICFFFKQKTAYELEYGLVGSEMCISDNIQKITPLGLKFIAIA